MEDPTKPIATALGADGDSIDRPQTKLISPTQEPGVKIPNGNEEYDPWDLDAARNRQKKDRRVKVVSTYRVARKPREGAFFRVNPDPAYQIDALLYIEKDERGMEGDTYLVDWIFAEEILASDWAIFFQRRGSISHLRGMPLNHTSTMSKTRATDREIMTGG